jgi:hypothetical protein
MAVPRVDGKPAQRLFERLIERERDEPPGTQIIGHQKCWLVDHPLTRQGRDPQCIAVAGAQVARNLDPSVGTLPEDPAVRLAFI